MSQQSALDYPPGAPVRAAIKGRMRPYLWIALLAAVVYGCSMVLPLPDLARVAVASLFGLLLLVSAFKCFALMRCPYCGWNLTGKKSARWGDYTSWSVLA